MSGALPRTADTPDKLVRRSAHRGIVLRYDKKPPSSEGAFGHPLLYVPFLLTEHEQN